MLQTVRLASPRVVIPVSLVASRVVGCRPLRRDAHGRDGTISRAVARGGVTSDESRPRKTGYTVKFDLSRGWFGQPLLAEIHASDGRVWLARVVSQGGAPAIQHLIGGDTPNDEPPPSGSLRAIHAELERLYEQGQPHERLILESVGFTGGVKRPTQPGKPPDSHHNLAVRARHVHENDGMHRALPTERDAYKRARAAKIVSRGELTEYGERLLQPVDAARDDLLVVLATKGERSDDDLRVDPGDKHTADAIQAALTDLELRGKISVRQGTCATCSKAHVYYALT